MKLICADRVSVGLSYDANFKWHMPTCVERYRVEKKYMPIFGTSPSALSGKKFQNMGTYTNWWNAALWIFFPQNALGDGPAFWIFPPGFTDKGQIVVIIHKKEFNPFKTPTSATTWTNESWNETNARTTSKGETRARKTKLHNSGKTWYIYI